MRRDSATYVSSLMSVINKKQEELAKLEHIHTALQTWEGVLQTSIVGMPCSILHNTGSSHSTPRPEGDLDVADGVLQDVLSMEAQALSQLAEAGVPADLESQLYTCTRLRAIAGTPLVQHVQTASPAELGTGLADYVKQLAVLLYKDASSARADLPPAEDSAELELLVDKFVDTALGMVFWAPDKAFHVCSINWATNEECSAPPAHWTTAAQRLQPLLQPQQEQQLVMGFRLFAKRRAILLEEQQQLQQQQMQDTAAACLSAAGQSEQEQLLQWEQRHHGNSRRLQQLERNVEALKVLSEAMLVLMFNSLTRRQLAELMVNCYPWQPCPMPFMQSLSELATPETKELCERLNRS